MDAGKPGSVVEPPELLKINEVAVRLRRSTEKVREMLRKGTLPLATVRIGGRSMVRAADLDRFLGPPAA